MHIGVLAAAAHAASSGGSFTIYYNPRFGIFSTPFMLLHKVLLAYITHIRPYNLFRTSPSPFVVPVARYNKANYVQQSVGMRMAMMFETEESSKRRFVP
jgi:auxin response factor